MQPSTLGPAATAFLGQTLDSLILQRKAEERALSIPADRRHRVAALCAASDELRSDASMLAAEARLVAAALILREAAVLLIFAMETASGRAPVDGEPPRMAFGQWRRRFDELVADGLVAPPPSNLAEADGIIAHDSALELRGALEEGAFDVLQPSIQWVTHLRTQIESRSPQRIRGDRRMRVVIAFSLLVALAVFGVRKALAPKNLARGKPVTVSSRRGGSGPPEDVVNGSIEDGYAFATNDESDPWLVVDLLKPAPIRAVRIYNRGDNYFDSALPFTVEISNDRTAWTAIGHQTTSFSRSDPATFKPGGAVARFVRVHGAAGRMVCFNEIEIN